MSDRSVTHATFSLERTYDRPPAETFAAWADPATKARWFTGASGADHELDFRVGGREVTTTRREGRSTLTFTSDYEEIVPGERIVYTSTLRDAETVVTVSMTTVELAADGQGTHLRLTEAGAFLDGQEQPSWREQGTGTQLDALGAELR